MIKWRIREILDEIEQLESDIESGHIAWHDEDGDPDAMAECDPSDQYCKGEEIGELVKELKEIVAKM